MAFSLNIEFYSLDTERPDYKIWPHWWRKRQLQSKFKFLSLERDPGYIDYILKVSKDELREIHEDQLKELEEGIYSRASWRELNNKPLAELESIFASDTKYFKIQIVIYEWESGISD